MPATQRDNDELRALLSTKFKKHSDAVIITNRSTANVSNPPTIAQLNAAFGTAADLFDGFTAKVNDNGAGTAVYLAVISRTSGGTNEWWLFTGTKAT